MQIDSKALREFYKLGIITNNKLTPKLICFRTYIENESKELIFLGFDHLSKMNIVLFKFNMNVGYLD